MLGRLPTAWKIEGSLRNEGTTTTITSYGKNDEFGLAAAAAVAMLVIKS